ncbi:hypothetical protein [Peptostreptococcus equinus]|uniref:DUF948 domain-containing protein n=1 Tax=Peptostreptococcus equinus TaxID=3003601 RepID=A0ABY7JTL1_9FIRM|nr:hypothetical protein [Peptostreptococcus sp. CBA3647]WAW15488.1 hypothetical protein O0R46_03320 [Peptostreptococcus sp. CBA3647]
MSFTIDMEVLNFILAIVGIIALVFLIMLFAKVIGLLKSVQKILDNNESNIDLTISTLPSITRNVDGILDNTKDISAVAVDVAADVLDVKEKVKSTVKTSVDVAKIVKTTFKGRC